MTAGLLAMLGLVVLAGSLVLLWHMQRPRPRRIAISFARFVPPLTPAPGGWHRIALALPREVPALLCLLAALALLAFALIDGERQTRASHPGHIGLRIVLDVTHSMEVMDGDRSRFQRALARVEAARRLVAGARAESLCLEIVAVGASQGVALPLAAEGPLPDALPRAPLPEGGEPARLLEAARARDGACPITGRLVVTDAPLPGTASVAEGAMLLWDQVGQPVGNVGLRGLALQQAAFGPQPAQLCIDGVASGMDAPDAIVIEGPDGARTAGVAPSPEAEGQWTATTAFAGSGRYRVRLPAPDGYSGDDAIEADITALATLQVDWRVDALPPPENLGRGDELLVAPLDAGVAENRARPALYTYSGFDAAASPRRLGAFLDDPPLLDALNLDALESAMPTAFPGPLPAGFLPVLTDEAGGVIAARRGKGPHQAPGLLVPAPHPGLPEPARSLSLTLFYSALADLATLPATAQPATWRDGSGQTVAEAWRESLTARPLAAPADLRILTETGVATQAAPLWPLLVLLALVALAGERGLRLWVMLHRDRVVP